MKMALNTLRIIPFLCILYGSTKAQNTAPQKSYLVVRASKNGGVLALVDNKNPAAITTGGAKIFPLDPGTYTLTLKDIKGNKFDTLINIINPTDLIKEGKKPPFRYEVFAAESYGDDSKAILESASLLNDQIKQLRDNVAKALRDIQVTQDYLTKMSKGTVDELIGKTDNLSNLKKEVDLQLKKNKIPIQTLYSSIQQSKQQLDVLKIKDKEVKAALESMRVKKKAALQNEKDRNVEFREIEILQRKEADQQKTQSYIQESEMHLNYAEADLQRIRYVDTELSYRFEGFIADKQPLSDSLKTAIKYHRKSDLKFFVNAQNADETKPDGNVFLIPYAVSQGASLETLKYFIQLGARPNKYNRVYSGTVVYYTPLMIASKQNQAYEIIEFLLQSGGRIYPEDASAERKKINTEHLYNAIKNNSRLLELFKRYDYSF